MVRWVLALLALTSSAMATGVPVRVRRAHPTPRYGPGSITFRRGSAVPHDPKKVLDAIAKELHDHPEFTLVEIVGHASANERRAKELGQQRAEAILDALVSHGVARERLTASSAGAKDPLVPARSKHRARNRRVEFIIRERAPAPAPD